MGIKELKNRKTQQVIDERILRTLQKEEWKSAILRTLDCRQLMMKQPGVSRTSLEQTFQHGCCAQTAEALQPH